MNTRLLLNIREIDKIELETAAGNAGISQGEWIRTRANHCLEYQNKHCGHTVPPGICNVGVQVPHSPEEHKNWTWAAQCLAVSISVTKWMRANVIPLAARENQGEVFVNRAAEQPHPPIARVESCQNKTTITLNLTLAEKEAFRISANAERRSLTSWIITTCWAASDFKPLVIKPPLPATTKAFNPDLPPSPENFIPLVPGESWEQTQARKKLMDGSRGN